MKWSRLIDQPRWLVALALACALLPAWLAVVTYRDARQKDERLYETSAQVLAEQLQRDLDRYLYFLGVLRNQARPLDRAALAAGRMTPAGFDWKQKLPHLLAFGFAEPAGGGIVLRWKSEEQASVAKTGEDLALSLQSETPIDPAKTIECLLAAHRLMVLLPFNDSSMTKVTRGYIAGWINLESLCRDAALPLIRDQVLTATPLDEQEAAPVGARRMNIREGGSRWAVSIARGAHFNRQFGPPTPWLAFIALGLSAVPLLVVLTLAGRAARLHAALATERELVHRQRFFIQSVSHEFRTPLGVILSGADLLESYADKLTPERKAEVLAEIKDNTCHMTRMLERVLLLGRIESGKLACNPKPVNVATHCHELARNVTIATHARSPITVTAPDRKAMLDAVLVGSILDNLLSNAVKYSTPGKPVTLKASVEDERLVFIVRDEGIGIPFGDMARVCDPFHRCGNVGDTPGTGLGLAIAQRCATLHGGALHIESAEGRGTTVTVTLPLIAPP